MTILLLAMTGFRAAKKYNSLLIKNETTLLAMDQHRAAKNEKRVPLCKGKNTFQQLQWWQDGMNDMTRAECKSYSIKKGIRYYGAVKEEKEGSIFLTESKFSQRKKCRFTTL